MPSASSDSSADTETDPAENDLIDLRTAPPLEAMERARELFAAANCSSPLYQARLARDPDYFKHCSPGRWIFRKKKAGAMYVLQLVAYQDSESCRRVRVLVDGIDLAEHARKVERPFAEAEQGNGTFPI